MQPIGPAGILKGWREYFYFEMGTFFSRLSISETGGQRGGGLQRSESPHSGVYRCAECQLLLFTSAARIALGNDWVSFRGPVCSDHIRVVRMEVEGSIRREILCGSCGTHLGFAFGDGPKPGGLRLSVVLSALNFHAGQSVRWDKPGEEQA
jgi:peptide methionine sulfoxide reductase MsrB